MAFEDVERTGEHLKVALSAAVPLWILDFKTKSWDEIKKIAEDASQVIAEHGDNILFKAKKKGESARAFNALAKGIAALSFVPGGVTLFGMHFESKFEPQEPT